jgi:IS5 family transposase
MTLRKLRRCNYDIQRVRCRIEKIFGTWKRSYGLRRMRWRGLAKATLQVHLTATAYNLRRSLTLLSEPPRVCRRPYLLRGWGYDEEDIEPVFA